MIRYKRIALISMHQKTILILICTTIIWSLKLKQNIMLLSIPPAGQRRFSPRDFLTQDQTGRLASLHLTSLVFLPDNSPGAFKSSTSPDEHDGAKGSLQQGSKKLLRAAAPTTRRKTGYRRLTLCGTSTTKPFSPS